MKRKCLCYVILPTFSIVGILGISWLIAAFVEIFTNNLTMIRIIESNLKNSHLYGDMSSYHGDKIMGDEDDNIFWFVQVYQFFTIIIFFNLLN